jgi:hypothetical protein
MRALFALLFIISGFVSSSAATAEEFKKGDLVWTPPHWLAHIDEDLQDGRYRVVAADGSGTTALYLKELLRKAPAEILKPQKADGPDYDVREYDPKTALAKKQLECMAMQMKSSPGVLFRWDGQNCRQTVAGAAH